MAGLDRNPATKLPAPTAAVVAVVAVAVGLGLVAATGEVGRREVAAADVGTRLVAAVVGASVGTVAVLALVVVSRRCGLLVGRSTVALALLAASVVAGAGAVDLTNGEPVPATSTGDLEPASAEGQGSTLEPGARPPAPQTERRGLPFDVDVEGTAILLIALGLLIVAITFFGRRTELRTAARSGVYLTSDLSSVDLATEATEPTDRRVGEALRSALEALDASGSPADRIRAAYATMLARFSEIGLGRDTAEPPGAYVDRCLRSRTLPRHDVERLLRLFELARFSRAVLDEADVEVARGALRAIVGALTTGAR
jgi:hypothetical protein